MNHFPTSIPYNELHLWCVTGGDIDDTDFVRHNEIHLCDSERARAERFHRVQDRNRFVIARGILRQALGAYLAMEPNEIAFCQNRYGRPEIAALGPNPVRFNVSHTDGFIAIAFASGNEVGVDAERILADFPHLEIARLHFSPPSYAELELLPSSLMHIRFFEYWVLLEAYAKGRGMGLSMPLTNQTFTFDATDHSIIRFVASIDAPSERWQFWLIAPSPDHRLAVAASGTLGRFVARRIGPECVEEIQLPILASCESSGHH